MHCHSPDIISDGIPPGAIQVPGHGMPIIMTADRQTTGGYPKIGVVTRGGLDRLAQRLPGEAIRLQPASLVEAEREFLQREDMLEQWRNAGPSIMKRHDWLLTIHDTRYHIILQEKE
jgi:allophanate hydrolase subunit 2